MPPLDGRTSSPLDGVGLGTNGVNDSFVEKENVNATHNITPTIRMLVLSKWIIPIFKIQFFYKYIKFLQFLFILHLAKQGKPQPFFCF